MLLNASRSSAAKKESLRKRVQALALYLCLLVKICTALTTQLVKERPTYNIRRPVGLPSAQSSSPLAQNQNLGASSSALRGQAVIGLLSFSCTLSSTGISEIISDLCWGVVESRT